MTRSSAAPRSAGARTRGAIGRRRGAPVRPRLGRPPAGDQVVADRRRHPDRPRRRAPDPRALAAADTRRRFPRRRGRATDAGSDARLQWIIDPLDGTVNFLYAPPGAAVSIAAALDGTSLPAPSSTCCGTRRSRPRRHAAPGRRHSITSSACPTLAQALVTTGFSYRADIRASQGAGRGTVCCPRCATCAASGPPPCSSAGSAPAAPTPTSSATSRSGTPPRAP